MSAIDSEREYTRKDIEGLRSLFTIDPVKSPEEAAKPTSILMESIF